MLTVLIEHHILLQPDTRSYAVLAGTCKKTRALLGERVWSDKWKFFQEKFLLQLDFFDRFKANLDLVEMDEIVFPIRGTYLMATVHRSWDFVREVLTVTARVVWCRTVERNAMWKGWEFTYVYDVGQTMETNIERINARLQSEARARQRELE
jgi:hypothetical protein